MGSFNALSEEERLRRVLLFTEDLWAAIGGGTAFSFTDRVMKRKVNWLATPGALKKWLINQNFIQTKDIRNRTFEFGSDQPDSIEAAALAILKEFAYEPEEGSDDNEEPDAEVEAVLNLDEIEWAVIKYALKKLGEGGNEIYGTLAQQIIDKIDS